MLKDASVYQHSVYSFPKEKRLLEKKDFDLVFSQASKLVTTEFVILYRKNTIEKARLGLALSKKKIAKSFQRNRLKRLLRETFRTHTLPPVDIVVVARTDAGKSGNEQIIINLSKAWKKLAVSYDN